MTKAGAGVFGGGCGWRESLAVVGNDALACGVLREITGVLYFTSGNGVCSTAPGCCDWQCTAPWMRAGMEGAS